jgi:hypothetical protein
MMKTRRKRVKARIAKTMEMMTWRVKLRKMEALVPVLRSLESANITIPRILRLGRSKEKRFCSHHCFAAIPDLKSDYSMAR